MDGILPQAIQELINAMKAAAPVLWEAAYKQAFVNGATALTILILVLLVALAITIWGIRVTKKEEDAEYLLISFFVDVIAFCIILISLVNILTDFFNPTYAAIKILMDMVH